MILLYNEDEKDFKGNGDYVLNNIIKDDKLEWSLFGQWQLTLTIPIHNRLGLKVSNGQYIKLPTPNFNEPQIFYVNHVERTLDNWDITAIHIYNKLKHVFLPGTLIRDKPLIEAANSLIKYQGLGLNYSITTDKPSAMIDANYTMINALQALSDESLDRSIITQSETEFTANNFEIQLLSRVGKDRGADIRYGRDLLTFVETVDATEIVGRVVPMGKSGFTIPESSGGPYITYKNYDPLIHQTRVIEYDITADYGEDEGKNDALPVSEAIRQLKRLGEREFNLNRIQEPIISYELDMYDLRNDFKGLQKIMPGDSVLIVDNKNNKINERIIEYSYRPTTKKYTSIKLANKTPSITAGEYAKRLHGGGTKTL